LEAESSTRTVAWLSSEGAGIVDPIAALLSPESDPKDCDVLGVMTFDNDTVDATHLGFAQSHGLWIDWRAAPTAIQTQTAEQTRTAPVT
jgi:hypothetical protein